MADSVLEQEDVEIDQQTATDPGQSHVGQHLRGKDVVQLVDGLQFHDDLAFDQQIQPITAVENDAPKRDGNRFLPFHSEAGFCQQMLEARLVCRFQHPRPQLPMDGDRRTDDRPSQRVPVHLCVLCVSAVMLFP
jgi:hypothetical protein